MDKVYEVLDAPGGIERALDEMREIKPHVAVWWSSGAHHAQLMKDGEVAATLPSSPQNAKVQFVYDADWWRINGARAEEMFDEMMTE